MKALVPGSQPLLGTFMRWENRLIAALLGRASSIWGETVMAKCSCMIHPAPAWRRHALQIRAVLNDPSATGGQRSMPHMQKVGVGQEYKTLSYSSMCLTAEPKIEIRFVDFLWGYI